MPTGGRSALIFPPPRPYHTADACPLAHRTGGTPDGRPGPLLLQAAGVDPHGRGIRPGLPDRRGQGRTDLVTSARRTARLLPAAGAREEALLRGRGRNRPPHEYPGNERPGTREARPEAPPVPVLRGAATPHLTGRTPRGGRHGAGLGIPARRVPGPGEPSRRTPRPARWPRPARTGRSGYPLPSPLRPPRPALLMPRRIRCMRCRLAASRAVRACGSPGTARGPMFDRISTEFNPTLRGGERCSS